MSTLLAIDPAYRKPIAWATWDVARRTPLDWGLWTPHSRNVVGLGVQAVAYESDHFGAATYGLGMAVGRILGMHDHLDPSRIRGVTSTTWRRALRLHATTRAGWKAAAVRWVRDNLGITPENDDIAEALCLGYVAAHWPWPWSDAAGSTPGTPSRRNSRPPAARKRRRSRPRRSSRAKSVSRTASRAPAPGSRRTPS